jgi:hypothetical protein
MCNSSTTVERGHLGSYNAKEEDFVIVSLSPACWAYLMKL